MGSVSTNVNSPVLDPGSNSRTLSIGVDHVHTDYMYTTAGGGGPALFYEDTESHGGGTWAVQNNQPSGTQFPVGSTITVSFTLYVTADDPGAHRQFALNLTSTLLNVVATDGTLVATDSGGNQLANIPGFADNDASGSFSIQFTVPAVNTIQIGYTSQYETGLTGLEGAGTESHTTGFGWNYQLVTN